MTVVLGLGLIFMGLFCFVLTGLICLCGGGVSFLCFCVFLIFFVGCVSLNVSNSTVDCLESGMLSTTPSLHWVINLLSS